MNKLLSMCLVLWCSLFLVSGVQAKQNEDWQFWNSSSLEGNVHPRWKLKFEEQFRFGDNITDFYYHLTGVSVTWKTTEWFQVALAYAQIYEQKADDWREENRPRIDGTVRRKWGGLQLSDRNRAERRIREKADNLWRYRNNLTLSPVKKWLSVDIQPYVSGEIFVDIEQKDFNQYRLTGGLTGRLVERLQAHLYYLRQGNEKAGDWTVNHVLGVAIKVGL